MRLFKIIIILAILIIVSFLGMFTLFVIHLNRVDYNIVYSKLSTFLDKEDSVITISKGSGSNINLSCYYPLKKHNKFDQKQLEFSPKPGEGSIYLYGASEVFESFPSAGKDYRVFPYILQDEIDASNKKNLKIYNFGMRFFDSFNIKKIVKESLKLKKPDLIIYYNSASADYIKAYMMSIKPEIFFFSRQLNSDFHFPKPLYIKLRNFFCRYFEPNAMEVALRLNLVKMNWEEVDRWNRLIISHYKENVEEIVKLAQDNAIPLVLIISINNLEERPYGKYPEAVNLYKKGLKEKDYSKRLDYFFKASDEDVFSLLAGRKTEVNNFLRLFEGRPGVYLFDLEKELISEKFDFGYDNFYDRVHLRKQTQALIGKRLYLYLKDRFSIMR